MKFLKREAKKGMLTHISNKERNGDFSLSQIGKQIKRGCFNFDDWSIEEDTTNWSYDESFVHSLVNRTYHIYESGWFRQRLDQLVDFKKTFQDEPFRRTSGRSEARSPLEFILGKWISNERYKWRNKQSGYKSENDWKWSQMKEAKIQMEEKPRLTEHQKMWDAQWNRFFIPILYAYNASNNKETYFTTKSQKTTRKDKTGRWIWSSQFRIDFPPTSFKTWKDREMRNLRGNFARDTQNMRRNYQEDGSRYKQLEMLNFLGVPPSQLMS